MRPILSAVVLIFLSAGLIFGQAEQPGRLGAWGGFAW